MKVNNSSIPESTSGGKNPKKNPPDYFGAFLLIALGSMFLLNNFGVLPWSIWGNIWRFWPVLLIVGGIQTLLGKSLIGNIIAAIIGALAFGLIISAVVNSRNEDFDNWMSCNFPALKPQIQNQKFNNPFPPIKDNGYKNIIEGIGNRSLMKD